MSDWAALLRTLESGLTILPDKPEESAAGTLRALWFAAAGAPRSVELAASGELPVLSASQQAALNAMIDQRLSGTPLNHLTGRQRFLDLEMYAAKGALIPRKETEIVGRAALDVIAKLAAERGEVCVVDVCTGSGNLALAYAAHEPKARVLAADLSADAIAVARQNTSVLGLDGRVDFRVGDLLAPFGADLDGQVDVLSCNPPYISSAKVGAMASEISAHEPTLAFDGGPFGIKILSRVIKEGLRLVRPGGYLCFELGLGQGPAMAQRVEKSGAYDEVRSFHDAAGETRAIVARVKRP